MPQPTPEPFDRVAHFPSVSGVLLAHLRTRSGLGPERLAELAELPVPRLDDLEAGRALPSPQERDAIERALAIPADHLDAQATTVVTALESRRTWLFVDHPDDRPPERRLRTVHGDHTFSETPLLLTGVRLHEEVAAVVDGTPLPPRTLRDEHFDWLARGAPAGPDLPLAGVTPVDEAGPADLSPIGSAVALRNQLDQGAWAPHLEILVRFDPNATPRASVQRRDLDGRSLPPAPPPPALADAPEPIDDDALIDALARLVLGARGAR